jgi:transcriptional regulator with XRE-family HTH domain
VRGVRFLIDGRRFWVMSVTGMAADSLPLDADVVLLVGWLREGVQVEDLADTLGVSRETIWYWQKSGRPPSRMGRRSLQKALGTRVRRAVKSGEVIPPDVLVELQRLGFKTGA